jgi:hypothetical protein
MIDCPKCGYTRTEADRRVMAGICPACGIAYAKWRARESGFDEANRSGKSDSDADVTLTHNFWQRCRYTFTYIPDTVDPMVFWSRVAVYLVFVVWGCAFIIHGVDWRFIGGSFLHNANLPFHEFGHVLFSPFGRFMAILGGSLFQIMMPLIAMLSFSLQMRNNFAAAIMLWWCGQNFIDVSPYIADAEHRAIPLIRGLSEDYHDWGNLLSMTGLVHRAELIASFSFLVGSLLLLLSFFWAGWILYCQKALLDRR